MFFFVCTGCKRKEEERRSYTGNQCIIVLACILGGRLETGHKSCLYHQLESHLAGSGSYRNLDLRSFRYTLDHSDLISFQGL